MRSYSEPNVCVDRPDSYMIVVYAVDGLTVLTPMVVCSQTYGSSNPVGYKSISFSSIPFLGPP